MDPKKKATIIGGCIIIVKVIVLAILFGGGVWGAGRFVKNNSFDASKYNTYKNTFSKQSHNIVLVKNIKIMLFRS